MVVGSSPTWPIWLISITMVTESIIPILFSYSNVIFGNGFITRIKIDGKALLEQNCEEICISSIKPLGFAGVGDIVTAFEDFEQTLNSVLYDIAYDSLTFEEFCSMISDFFVSNHFQLKTLWKDSLRDIRKNNLIQFDLPRINLGDLDFFYSVNKLSLHPDENQFCQMRFFVPL